MTDDDLAAARATFDLIDRHINAKLEAVGALITSNQLAAVAIMDALLRKGLVSADEFEGSLQTMLQRLHPDDQNGTIGDFLRSTIHHLRKAVGEEQPDRPN